MRLSDMEPRAQQFARDLARDWQAMTSDEQDRALFLLSDAERQSLALTLALVACANDEAEAVPEKKQTLSDVLKTAKICWH